MTKTPKIESTDDAWDSGALGREDQYVRVSESVNEHDIDASVGLVPVSIRLQQSLIEDFKMIAKLNGIGYQPLMRQILTRFAECEKKKIISDMMHEEGMESGVDDDPEDPNLKRA